MNIGVGQHLFKHAIINKWKDLACGDSRQLERLSFLFSSRLGGKLQLARIKIDGPAVAFGMTVEEPAAAFRMKVRGLPDVLLLLSIPQPYSSG
jgi:hypothetical protein